MKLPGTKYLEGLVALGVTSALLDGPMRCDLQVIERNRLYAQYVDHGKTNAFVTYFNDNMRLSFQHKPRS